MRRKERRGGGKRSEEQEGGKTGEEGEGGGGGDEGELRLRLRGEVAVAPPCSMMVYKRSRLC